MNRCRARAVPPIERYPGFRYHELEERIRECRLHLEREACALCQKMESRNCHECL